MSLIYSDMERISCRNILLNADREALDNLFERVENERLLRKYNDITLLYESAIKDWNQTAYEIMLKMMDVGVNKSAYQSLAHHIPYRYLLREASSALSVEALLIGGSGLLSMYDEDEYISQLKEQWNHLANKYDLSPMRYSEWNLARVRPYNQPVLRLAQLSTLLHSKEFIVNRIIDCKSVEDVENLFCVEASEYWKNHFVPARESINVSKRIGKEKSHILGINLVVPIQIAYSDNIGKRELRNRAMTLLGILPAENNRYTRRWQQEGLFLKNAKESQAVIQIVTEYCQKERCAECPVMQMGQNL